MGRCPARDLNKISILENRHPAGFVYVTVMLLDEPYEGASVDRGGSDVVGSGVGRSGVGGTGVVGTGVGGTGVGGTGVGGTGVGGTGVGGSGGFVGRGSGGAGVSVGGTGVGARVGTTPSVGVGVGRGDGCAVGSVLSPASTVVVARGVGVAGAISVLGVQNSVTCGSSPARMDTSRHVVSVSASVSKSHVTAPASTARRVTCSSASIRISAGMLKSVMEQIGTTNSYEGFCAKNWRLPFNTVTCRRGKVRGFWISIAVPGASSSVLPSPR